MLKSKGEQIEFEHSFERDEHQTIIKVAGMEFSATDSKKAQSKRLAANKFIEFLKSSVKKQTKNDFSSDDSESDESDDESISEKEEEPIVKLKVNTFQAKDLSTLPEIVTAQDVSKKVYKSNFSDSEPLWGNYKKESPFIVSQRKPFKQGSNTQIIDELKKRYFGDDFEGPSNDKIEKLILLIKRFNSGYLIILLTIKSLLLLFIFRI